jgi:protein-S-isoprenylcysteine O-methyltransferase Ste14
MVRHPAYIGGLTIYFGQYLFGFAKHTFLRECVAWKFPLMYRSFLVFVIMISSVMFLNALKRAVKEDEMLRKKFGKEWEEWARKTRYRFVPGIW